MPRACRRVLTVAAFVALSFYGTRAASAAPQVDSLSPATATRSGRVLISGSGFGASQGGGRVEIGGVSPARLPLG